MKLLGLTIPFTKALVQPSVLPGPGTGGGRGWINFIREGFAGAWQSSSVTVDPQQDLLAFSAVFACITRIASDIGKLRLRLVENKDGVWSEVPRDRNSPFSRVLARPNTYQNRIQFIIAWLVSKLIFGNTYVLRIMDNRGVVSELHVLDPRRVLPLITENGDVYYQVANDNLARVEGAVTVPARFIIHDRAITLYHPLIGVSPLYAAGFAATQGRRIQGNSATFFENMSRPSGMLTGPSVIDDVTADRLKRAFEQNFSAEKIGRLAVLGDGLKYEPMTIPPHDAQMIEQLRWTVEDVARAFSVPLHKINSGPAPTSNNVEALEQQYYSGCLQILLESVEVAMDDGLALPPDLATEFDLDGLLRMDSVSMADYLTKLVGGGVMAPDEARSKVNLRKVPGGSMPYMQQQNWSLEQLAKRDLVVDAAPVAAPAVSDPQTDPDEDGDPEDQAAQEDKAYRQRTEARFLELMEKITDQNEEFRKMARPPQFLATDPDPELIDLDQAAELICAGFLAGDQRG